MSDYPAITAIVNTYERPDLLDRALASVLAQDFTDFEVLVVHDGPADDATAKVCERYFASFTQRGIEFNFFALDENTGYQCVPKNIATWHARGDYIAYLDDDNEWTADHLSVLFEAIEEGTVWPDFTYGRRLYVDDRPADQREKELYVGESPFVPFDERGKSLLAVATTNFIDTSDALIAKGALWRLQMATGKMWNEGFRRFGDWEMFSRGVFFAGWRGKGVDKVVQTYHWHGKNIQLTRPVRETPQQERIGANTSVHAN